MYYMFNFLDLAPDVSSVHAAMHDKIYGDIHGTGEYGRNRWWIWEDANSMFRKGNLGMWDVWKTNKASGTYEWNGVWGVRLGLLGGTMTMQGKV